MLDRHPSAELFREEGAAFMGNLAQLDTIMNDLIHMGDGKPFDDPFIGKQGSKSH